MPRVSVVTPVHNEAEYLGQCIESVLAQTYPNWDYTILDNCSTDASLEIARRYAVRDRRIRIVQNDKLLPILQNHNAALRQVSHESKYCKIVFADDLIFPECLDRMVAVAEEDASIAIVSAYSLVGQEIKCVGLPYPIAVADGREVCRRHWLDRRYLWGSANTVLYRSDLVKAHDPFFNEDNIHADDEVCFALLRTWNFGFVHQVLTLTRVRPESMAGLTNDMCTECASTLQILAKYGAHYLTPEELKARVGQQLASYYRVLGYNLLRGRDKRFWDYHRQKLIQAGFGFSRFRVMTGALAVPVRLALNLGGVLPKILKILKKQNPRERHSADSTRRLPDQIGPGGLLANRQR